MDSLIPLIIGMIFMFGWIIPLIAGIILLIRKHPQTKLMFGLTALWLIPVFLVVSFVHMQPNEDGNYLFSTNSGFDMNNYSGAIGSVSMPFDIKQKKDDSGKYPTLMLESKDQGYLNFTVTENTIKIPAGVYYSGSITHKGEKLNWSGEFIVLQDKSFQIPKEFSAEVEYIISHNEIGVVPYIYPLDDSHLRITIDTDMAMQFAVVDVNGKEYWRDAFEYG